MNPLEIIQPLDEDALAGAVGGKETYCIMQKGETLASLAKRFGTTVRLLCELNHIDDKNACLEGQRIRIR